MRTKLLGVVAICVLALTVGTKAATVDISGDPLNHFFVYPPVSQTYIFQPGETVDFGTAYLTAYVKCFGTGGCVRQGESITVVPIYGPVTSFQISHIWNDLTSSGSISQCDFPCTHLPGAFSLLFTMPSTETMITILFDAVAVTITPPVGALSYQPPAAVPLPATLPLFATGLGMLGLLGWRRKRII